MISPALWKKTRCSALTKKLQLSFGLWSSKTHCEPLLCHNKVHLRGFNFKVWEIQPIGFWNVLLQYHIRFNSAISKTAELKGRRDSYGLLIPCILHRVLSALQTSPFHAGTGLASTEKRPGQPISIHYKFLLYSLLSAFEYPSAHFLTSALAEMFHHPKDSPHFRFNVPSETSWTIQIIAGAGGPVFQFHIKTIPDTDSSLKRDFPGQIIFWLFSPQMPWIVRDIFLGLSAGIIVGKITQSPCETIWPLEAPRSLSQTVHVYL